MLQTNLTKNHELLEIEKVFWLYYARSSVNYIGHGGVGGGLEEFDRIEIDNLDTIGIRK